MVIYFIYLYRQNNAVAVFLANLFRLLLSKVDSAIGASRFMNECLESILEYMKQSFLMLIGDHAILAFFKSMFDNMATSFFNHPAALPLMTEAYRLGTIQAAPEIVAQMTPTLIQGVSEAVITNIQTSAVPMLENTVTGAVTGAIQTSVPMLENAVTGAIQSSTPMLQNAMTTTMNQMAQTTAANALYGKAFDVASNVAIKYGLSTLANQFGLTGVADVIPRITNGGSRIWHKTHKRTTNTHGRQRHKRRGSRRLTHKRRRQLNKKLKNTPK